MGRDEWDKVWLVIGVAGALALGVALTPIRTLTAASNLAFAFLALTVSRTRSDLDALRQVARQIEAGEPWDAVLDELRRAFGLARVALRDADGRLLGTAPTDARTTAIPATELEPQALMAAGEETLLLGHRGFRLPEGGGRLRLAAAPGFTLDLWAGDAEGLPLDDRKALAIAASIVAPGLARRR